MIIVKPSAELLWITPNAERAIEFAGRTCYKSEDSITEETSSKFVKMLLKRGHDAMIEHASASIKFVTDRGVTHELVRHRLPAYGQESTRYCNYSKEKFSNQISIIVPPGLTEDQYTVWEKTIIEIEKAYMILIDDGVPPQIARSILPNCLKTEIVVTTNLREWRHIFKLRKFGTAGKPHPQIKEIMDIAFELLYKECPNVFADLISQ